MVLGAGAVEFVLCHAEVQIAFVEEKKIGEVYSFTGMYFLLFHPNEHSKIQCSLQVALAKTMHDFILHHTYIFSTRHCCYLRLQLLFSISFISKKNHKVQDKRVCLVY